jgi:hypothetical protein
VSIFGDSLHAALELRARGTPLAHDTEAAQGAAGPTAS